MHPSPAYCPLEWYMTKILYYDIETAPNLAYVWGQYQQDVIEHQREWYMLCVSYKWEGQKRTKVCSLIDFPETYAKDFENDVHVVSKLWELIDEADIVIAHNGDKFDMRKANARFVKHGLGPPSPVASVDTLKVARKYFMFNSNRLNHVGKHLGLGEKVQTGGFQLWAGCMRGDMKSWKRMIKYARQDVDLLREVYLKLRPWMTNHPNNNMYKKEDGCPTCGGTHMQRRGYKVTKTMRYVQMQCQTCGAYSRKRIAEKTEKPSIVP